MKIRCHYCEEPLKNGMQFALECSCGNCKISFDKEGKIKSYIFSILDKGKEYHIAKFTEGKTSLYEPGKFPILRVEIDIELEDGVPKVYKTFERMKNLIIFS